MQCRICFEEGGDLLAPCECRGTASYIHRACLDQYIQYYPDRYCRVCRTYFNYYDSPQEIFLAWTLMVALTLLLLFSSALPIVKIVLFILMSGLCFYFFRRKLFDITTMSFLAILLILFVPGGNPNAMYMCILILGISAFIYTLSCFLPAHVVLSIVVGAFISAYTGFIVVVLHHTLDSSAFGVFISVLYMAWYAWLHARLRMP